MFRVKSDPRCPTGPIALSVPIEPLMTATRLAYPKNCAKVLGLKDATMQGSRNSADGVKLRSLFGRSITVGCLGIKGPRGELERDIKMSRVLC